MKKQKKQSRIIRSKNGFELQHNFGKGWKTETTLLVFEDSKIKGQNKCNANGVEELLSLINWHMDLGLEFIGFYHEAEAAQ